MPGVVGLVRRLLVGRPLATDRMEEERVGILFGLAVFAADAMSSVAYGPEEVLLVLVLAGMGGLHMLVPVALALAVLIIVVATSYRQTVMEYPSGGGAYVVARDNLGVLWAQVAGAALLTAYVLTVSVSVAAGVVAITSAWPVLAGLKVPIGVVCITLITVVNLRGVRESAAAFAIPVYGFILCVLGLIVGGVLGLGSGKLGYHAPTHPPSLLEPLTLFLVLRGFSSGCASLTGIEAVANGVEAFREPRGRNAASVMTYLATILAITVIGVAYISNALGVVPSEHQTVMSQLGERVYGRGWFYYALQTTTALILILAANTSFAGFPRLAAFMAADGYMPRQMMNLGDRLVFANGIIALAVLSALLLIGFQGEVTRLMPLYAVGVFVAFTASQMGMVRHWMRKRGSGWALSAAVNGVGATSTAVVLIVVAVTKFMLGAWVVCIVMPLMVMAFRAIHSHYSYVASRLTLQMAPAVRPVRNISLLLVGGMHRGTLEALQYMKAQAGAGRAIHVEVGGEAEPRIKREWDKWEKELPLEIVPSPYRNLTENLLEYIRTVREQEGYDYVTIILPEFVVKRWWETFLHNHTALWLQVTLHNVPGVAVLNMRYKL